MPDQEEYEASVTEKDPDTGSDISSTESPHEDAPDVESSDTAPDERPPIIQFPKQKSKEGNGQGIHIPFKIPDAPDPITVDIIWNDFWDVFQAGIRILQQVPNEYDKEIPKASWWRFWVLAGFNAVIYALALLVSLPGGIIGTLLGFIVTIPIALAITYGTMYISHWWLAEQQEGKGSLLLHSYVVALPYITMSIIVNAATLVLTFFGFGIITILLLALTVYSLYVSAQGLVLVHRVDKQKAYIAGAIILIADFFMSIFATTVIASIVIFL